MWVPSRVKFYCLRYVTECALCKTICWYQPCKISLTPCLSSRRQWIVKDDSAWCSNIFLTLVLHSECAAGFRKYQLGRRDTILDYYTASRNRFKTNKFYKYLKAHTVYHHQSKV